MESYYRLGRTADLCASPTLPDRGGSVLETSTGFVVEGREDKTSPARGERTTALNRVSHAFTQERLKSPGRLVHHHHLSRAAPARHSSAKMKAPPHGSLDHGSSTRSKDAIRTPLLPRSNGRFEDRCILRRWSLRTLRTRTLPVPTEAQWRESLRVHGPRWPSDHRHSATPTLTVRDRR